MVTFSHDIPDSGARTLRSLISSISQQSIAWQIESGFETEDECAALFSARTPDKKRKYHLHAAVTPEGVSYHYSVS